MWKLEKKFPLSLEGIGIGKNRNIVGIEGNTRPDTTVNFCPATIKLNLKKAFKNVRCVINLIRSCCAKSDLIVCLVAKELFPNMVIYRG